VSRRAKGEAESQAWRGTSADEWAPGRWSHEDLLSRDDERMDWKLELITVPVSDVDRAKAFYTEQVGFNADHDHTVSDEIRFVQLTPPGSACSIAIGKGLTQMAPGSLQNIQVVVSDIDAARAELLERGVEASDVQDLPGGRFVFFSDPDGNGWVVQLPSGA
jgi:catechol 2,3-dioxygenase-like lactoylglutathione lyase family enzyme